MSDQPIHRESDSRSCGASTVVAGQSSVYANDLLVSVDGDPNSHGGGVLVAATNQVFVEDKLVVNVGDTAGADSLCPDPGGEHCSPDATSGSSNVYVGD